MGGDDKHKDLVRKPIKTYWKGQPDLNRSYYTTDGEEEDATTEARPRPTEAGPAEVQGLLCDQPWACAIRSDSGVLPARVWQGILMDF